MHATHRLALRRKNSLASPPMTSSAHPPMSVWPSPPAHIPACIHTTSENALSVCRRVCRAVDFVVGPWCPSRTRTTDWCSMFSITVDQMDSKCERPLTSDVGSLTEQSDTSSTVPRCSHRSKHTCRSRPVHKDIVHLSACSCRKRRFSAGRKKMRMWM
jgi:hypothetical protein